MNRPLAAGTSRVPPKPPAVATQRVSVSHLGAPRIQAKRESAALRNPAPQFFDRQPPLRLRLHGRRATRQPVHRPRPPTCWPTGMQSLCTDTPAEDNPAVSRAIHQAYQRTPSGNTDSELYPATTTSATFATCRACSSSATTHAAAAQPTQPAPVSPAARTVTGSASLTTAAAPRAPTCPNAQLAMNNWLGPQRCPLSTRARSARHNCRRRAPRLRRSRRRPRRACARPPPGARHCAP